MNNLDNLVCVLLYGPPAADLTATARGIAAPNGIIVKEDFRHTYLEWDFKLIDAPLREIHSIRLNTVGDDSFDRQLWLIHEVLTDLIPFNSINFDYLVELIYACCGLQINPRMGPDEEIISDQDFLDGLKSYLIELTEENFLTQETIRRILTEFRTFEAEYEEAESRKIVIVPDIKSQADVDEFLKLGCKVIVIELAVGPYEEEKRLNHRYGKALALTRKWEPNPDDLVKEEFIDLLLNADTLDVKDQVRMIREFVLGSLSISDQKPLSISQPNLGVFHAEDRR